MNKTVNEYGMLRVGETYRKASEKLINDDSLIYPTLYLLGHSIEISLKAFLRTKEFNIDQITDLGHDLVKLLKTSKEHDLEKIIPPSEFKELSNNIKKLNKYYNSPYDLKYPQSGVKTLPNIKELIKQTKNLQNHLEPHLRKYREKFNLHQKARQIF